MPNFKQTIETLMQADMRGELNLSFSEYVVIANLFADPERVVLRTPADVLAFARTLPEVTDEIAAGRKIVAIKALRTASESTDILGETLKARPDANYLGLKAAKDACEALAAEITPVRPAYVTCPECHGNLNETTTWSRCPANRHNHPL